MTASRREVVEAVITHWTAGEKVPADLLDPDVSIEILKIEIAGEDVATEVLVRTRAVGSGVPIERLMGLGWRVRDGRLVRFAWSNDREAPFRALHRADH